MNIVKKAYQYLFYKLYRFSESMHYPWWSEYKSYLIISILIGNIIFTICGYFRILNPTINLLPNKGIVLILILVISALNYFMFLYKDRWKKIVKDFDLLPKKKNRLGGWLVLVFVVIVFISLFYVFYLGSQIDWSQYQ